MYELTTIKEYTDKKGEKKLQYNRVGVMFPNKAGTGFNITLDVYPLAQDGKVSIYAFPPKEKTNQPAKEKFDPYKPSSKKADSVGFDIVDDELPF